MLTGLALLDVVHTLPAFAAGYAYNSVDNFFIERAPVAAATRRG